MNIYELNDAWNNKWDEDKDEDEIEIEKKNTNKEILNIGFINIIRIYFTEYFNITFIITILLLIFLIFILKN